MFRIFVLFLSLTFSSLVYAALLQQHQRLADFDQYEEEVWVESVDTPVIEPTILSTEIEQESVSTLPTAVPQSISVPFIPFKKSVVPAVVAETVIEPEPQVEPEIVVESVVEVELELAPEPAPKKSNIIFIKGGVVKPARPALALEQEPTTVDVVAQPESASDFVVELQSPPSLETTEIAESAVLKMDPVVEAASLTIAPLQINKASLQNPAVNSSELITNFDTETQGVTSTIEDMIRKALDWHPSLRQARSQILASQEGIDAAKAPYFPQVSSGFNTGYRDSTGRDDEYFNVSASQLLYDFGKTSSGVKRANHEHNLEQARLLLNIDQLIEQTASASLEIMRSQEKEQVATQQMTALTELWELAKDRAQMGASAESDSIQALSRKEAATALLWQLQAQADLWQKQLQSLTGEKGTVRLLTAFPDQLGLQCQNHQLMLDQVPSMRIVEEERGSALAQLELSDANLYPTISVDAAYDQYLRSRQNFANGRLENRSSDFSVMLNMNMSLFEGGGKVAQKNAARYALQAVDAQKESAVLEVTRGFEESQQKQLLLSNRLRVLLERIGSIERTQELYKDQYIGLGTRSLLDLLNTEQEIYQAKSDYIDNKYEMYKAQIACLYYGAQLRHAFDISTTQSSGG